MNEQEKGWLRDWVKECQEIFQITGQGLLGERAIQPFHYYIQDRQRAELEASSRGAGNIPPPSTGTQPKETKETPPTAATTAPAPITSPAQEGPLFVNVGGSTWIHRDILKATGLVWEPLEQLWHGKLTQPQIEAVTALAGIKLKVGRIDPRDMKA